MTRSPRWHVQMTGRDPAEPHRSATPLELLFDLCFVVAVAQASIALHHEMAAGRFATGVISYLMVFFAIWWAWMNFTWFASAFDTDDVLYRLLTFVQIAGVLVIAAGVQRSFEGLDYVTITVGYLIMRVGLIALWVRAAIEHPERRATALRYALAVGVLQVGWVARLFLPPGIAAAGFPVLVALELMVPIWAESTGRATPWHRGHIAERYGLFTIIVLGESVLAATTAVQEAITAQGLSGSLVLLAIGGLVLIGAMWWAYFKHDAAEEGDLEYHPFVWGYGHYVVFASVAAVGAGLQLMVDIIRGDSAIGPVAASMAVAVPASVYLLAAWFVSSGGRRRSMLAPVGGAAALLLVIAVVIGGGSSSAALVAMSLVVAGLVGFSVFRSSRSVTFRRS